MYVEASITVEGQLAGIAFRCKCGEVEELRPARIRMVGDVVDPYWSPCEVAHPGFFHTFLMMFRPRKRRAHGGARIAAGPWKRLLTALGIHRCRECRRVCQKGIVDDETAPTPRRYCSDACANRQGYWGPPT